MRAYIKTALLLCGISLLLFPVLEITGSLTFPLVPKRLLENITVTTQPNGKKTYAITDLSYGKIKGRTFTDIILSFNKPSSELVRDDTKNYTLKKALYTFIQGKGSLGKGCAQFYQKDHRVEVAAARDLWLGSCGDLGSFTLEFRFQVQVMKENAVLFSRVGMFTGGKRGLEILLKNKKLSARMFGMFIDPQGKRHDVMLNDGRPLTEGKWYHFSLSYDRISGKLSRFCNGEEEETVYLTDSGDPFNGVFVPTFGNMAETGKFSCLDQPTTVLGKDFSGLLDEFRITYIPFEDLKKATKVAYTEHAPHGLKDRDPYNIEGIVTSPVYDFKNTGTRITLFKWNEVLSKNTFVWMELRISDKKFGDEDSELKWYKVVNFQRGIYLMKDEAGDYLRGRYCQWRAHLVASPLGKYSPHLSDIEMKFQRDLPPNPPLFFTVAATGDTKVILRWKKNVEPDIMGYRIYYGTHPKKYDGIIRQLNEKRITNAMAKDNYIEVAVDNDIIEENALLDDKKVLTFPKLQNTVLYFFAVSAYDTYKAGTVYNHESDLSKQVTARPYAGSDIK